MDITFKKYYKSLELLFDDVDVHDFKIKNNDDRFLRILKYYGIHRPDNRIVLDAFKSAKYLKSDVFFITRIIELLKMQR